MNIKGTPFVAGKVSLIENFGEGRWNSFMAKLAQKENYFSNMIMSVTIIPLDKFIFFIDEITKEYFNNDNKVYLLFGMASAKYALSPGGPYNSYLLTKDLKQFVESGMPKIWSTYFDGGIFDARFENNVVHLKISEIPIKHIYFEYMVMGYFKQALKIFGKKSIEKGSKVSLTAMIVFTTSTN
jgi:hypothetical protein